MDMGKFLIETHLQTGRSIKELAAAHDVSARRLFKLLRRYRLEGPAGLEPRSRRPHRSPTRIADVYEDEIVARHKALADDGLDAGAATIHFHLSQRYCTPPSISTIFRVLKARGFVALEPHKRPKSSFKTCSRHRYRARCPRHDACYTRAIAGRANRHCGGSRRRDRLGVMGCCLIPGETTGRLDPRRGSGGRDRVGLPLDVRVRTPHRHRMVERDRTRSGHLQQVASLFSKQSWNVAPTALHPS